MRRPGAVWWVAMVGGLGLGLGTARGADATARYIPAAGLAAYVEFDGLDGHADDWKATAAYAALNKTPAGAMIEDVAAQLLAEWLKDLPGGRRAGPEVVALHEQLIRRGFACGLDEAGAATVVIRGGGREEVRDRFARLIRLATDAGDAKPAGPIRVRGRSLRATPQGVSWWIEGDDLILVSGKPEARAGAVLDALEGRQPSAETHPTRVALVKAEVDFEPDGLFFAERKALGAVAALSAAGPAEAVEFKALDLPAAKYPNDDVKYLAPPAPTGPQPAPAPKVHAPAPQAPPAAPAPAIPEHAPDKDRPAAPPEVRAGAEPAAETLEGVERVEGRWGFRGKALAGDVRVVAPAPRKGWAALADQPAFRKDRLPPIPEGVGSFTVVAIAPGKVYGRGLMLLDAIDPDAKGQFRAVEGALADATGVSLRDDLLAHLGPTLTVFTVPARPKELRKQEKADERDPVILAEMADAAAFTRALDAAAAGVDRALKAAPGGSPLELRPLPAPARGYSLGPAPGFLTPWPLAKTRPTVMLGKRFVAFAATPEEATAALAAEAGTARRWTPAGELAERFARLPGALVFLDVVDPHAGSLTGLIANLPGLVQFLGNTAANPDAERSPLAGVLGAFGLPAPGAFLVRIDPAREVKVEDLEAHLFPNLLAASVDDRGVRIIGRGSIPAGFRWGHLTYSTRMVKSSGGKWEQRSSVEWKLGIK